MRYEINEQLEIRMFRDSEDVPFLYQPHYPDGTPFESVEAADLWASEYKTALEASDV